MVKKELAEYVVSKGIKQVYLCEKTGLSPQAMGALLKGERKLDVEEYAKICDALGVDYDFFFTDTNEQKGA